MKPIFFLAFAACMMFLAGCVDQDAGAPPQVKETKEVPDRTADKAPLKDLTPPAPPSEKETATADNRSVCPQIREPVCGTDGKTYDNQCLADQAKISIAYNGDCNVCNDTDAVNITAKGFVFHKGKIYEDTCQGDTKVLEYVCNVRDGAKGELMNCPNGYYCKDGACIINPVSCTDSENTLDTMNAGYIKTADALGKVSYSFDYCLSATKVRDYYCDDAKGPTSATSDCAKGYACRFGRCEKNPDSQLCFDSDGGKNYPVLGRTEVKCDKRSDHCASDDTLIEYYCKDTNTIEQDAHYCPEGCSKGKCGTVAAEAPHAGTVVFTSCTDSGYGDALMDYRGQASEVRVYEDGFVSRSDKQDTCNANFNGVIRYYCENGVITSKMLNCPASNCKDGMCVAADNCPPASS